MILLLAIIVGVGAGLLSGGQIANLRNYRLVGEGWMLFLLLLSLGIPRVAQLGKPYDLLAYATWLATMGALFVLSLLNRHSSGILLAGIGIASNLIVITVNHGMPADARALRIAGYTGSLSAPSFSGTFHHVATPSTRLLLLSDVIPVPGPRFVQAVASPGDVLLMAGVTIFLGWAIATAQLGRPSPGAR